jgi:uncharacterized membrane protein YdcZ (DUF606 family)
MGSPAIAAFIAHISFLILVLYGWFCEEIGPRAAAVFLALWIGGFYGLSYLPYGAGMFSSYVAILDIALVLVIFKGDLKVG